MQDLIAKLEAAAEGSRELDAEIVGKLWADMGVFARSTLPLYTTSLDAAVALVPEGTAP